MIDRLQESTRVIELYKQRTTLLEASSGEVNANISIQGEKEILERGCKILFANEHKPKGEGTGLGLAQDSNRYLRVQNTFGEYTSLIVGLPTHQPIGENNGR